MAKRDAGDMPVMRMAACALLALLSWAASVVRAQDVLVPPEDVMHTAAAVSAQAVDSVMHAVNLVGTPYRRRGNSPEQGFDCSGFIRYVFSAAHRVDLPRSARDMFALGQDRAAEIKRDAIETGDLLFFRIGRLGKQIDHVGLYLGEQRFVHAPATGGEVRIDTLELPYWQRHFAGARRIFAGAVSGDNVSVSRVGDTGGPADAASAIALPAGIEQTPENEEATP